MKRLTCEMCNSNDLVKEEGLFVCQHCGVKYSIEEAKKLMVEGVVEVTGTVKIDTSDDVKNYLDVANAAVKSKDYRKAIDFADKALELNPKEHKAWLLKMEWLTNATTIDEFRNSDVVSSGSNAIEFAPPADKAAMKRKVYSYFLSSALLSVKSAPGLRYFGGSDYDIAMQEVHSVGGAADLVGSVPVKAIEYIDEFQQTIREISEAFEACLTDCSFVAQQTFESMSSNDGFAFNKGLLTEGEKEEKHKEKAEIISKYISDHPEAGKVISEKKANVDNIRIKINETENVALEFENLFTEESEKIKQLKEYKHVLKDAIIKNRKKLFGKEKAQQAALSAEAELEGVRAELSSLKTNLSSIEKDISSKEKEMEKLKTALQEDEQYLDIIILEAI